MTKGELDRLRAEEKARARLVRFECMKRKRIKQIKEHRDTILDVMTATILILLVGAAFTVDAFGILAIPGWLYLIGSIYLAVYIYLNYKRFFE